MSSTTSAHWVPPWKGEGKPDVSLCQPRGGGRQSSVPSLVNVAAWPRRTGRQGDCSGHGDLPRLEEASIPVSRARVCETWGPGGGPRAGLEGVGLAWRQLEGCQGHGSSLFLSLHQWRAVKDLARVVIGLGF